METPRLIHDYLKPKLHAFGIVHVMNISVLSSETLITPFCACAGFIGMALSYGLSLNNSFVFSIQNQCQLSNQIISVERVNQYMDIPSEAAEIIEENRPSPNWPQVGRVYLRDLKVNLYKHLHVCLTTKPFCILGSRN